MSVNELTVKDNVGLKKYRQAAYGFLVINLVYVLLFYIFPPPFEPGLLGRILITILLVTLIAALAHFINKGYKKLVIILAVVYGARFSAILIFTLTTGTFMESVPYVLTCLGLTFYMLGRAAWDWL